MAIKRTTSVGSNDEFGSNNLPKLSEFENDLYYPKKRTSFLKLTKDDFVWDEDRNYWYYKQTPKLNWLDNKDKIGYNLILKPDESTYFKYNEINTPLEEQKLDDIENNYTCILLSNEMLTINNGLLSNNEKENSFYIIFNAPYEIFANMNELNLELFETKDGRKIPSEVLDLNKPIALKYNYTSTSIDLNYDENNIYGLLTTGGILHIVMNIGYYCLDFPILFHQDCLLQYTTYSNCPVYMLSSPTKTIIVNSSNSNEIFPISAKITLHGKFGWGYASTNPILNGCIPRLSMKIVATNSDDTQYTGAILVSNVYFEPKSISESLVV